MIKITFYIFVLLLLVSISIFSQEDSLRKTEIRYYDLTIKLNWNNKQFFTGCMSVEMKGVQVFRSDSTFSDYTDHKLIDLDGDGRNELVLNVTEGASPYIYNKLVIFDRELGESPKFIMQNADIVEKKDELPKIVLYSRMSPSVLGLGYNWLVEYKFKKIRFFKSKGTNWADYTSPDIKGTHENLKQFEDGGFKCDEDNYITFFESVMIQAVISGSENEGRDFFSKHYGCSDKVQTLKRVENSADEVYSWIRDEKNYLYGELQ